MLDSSNITSSPPRVTNFHRHNGDSDCVNGFRGAIPSSDFKAEEDQRLCRFDRIPHEGVHSSERHSHDYSSKIDIASFDSKNAYRGVP